MPIDPYLHIYQAQTQGQKPKLIPLARTLNDQMPGHVVSLVKNALRKSTKK